MSFIQVGASLILEIPGRSLSFPANPDMQRSINVRLTVAQTPQGIYTDEFGEGVQTIVLSGDSAWNSNKGKYNGKQVDGNTAMRHLEMDIIRYYLSSIQKNPNLTMRLYDDVRNQAWQVKPMGNVQFTASKTSPITLGFTLQFIVIKDLTNGMSTPKVVDPVKPIFQTPASIQKYVFQQMQAIGSSLQSTKQTPAFRYQVKTGDTLWTIAEQFLPRTSSNVEITRFVNEIVTKNYLSNPNLIFVGQILLIPSV